MLIGRAATQSEHAVILGEYFLHERRSPMNIVISTSTFGQYSKAPLQLLSDAGFAYTLNPYGRKLTEKETEELIQDCVGLIAGTEPITRHVIASASELKVISRCGVGMDNVDINAAEDRGVAVRNTPYGPTLAVAELTLGLALDLLRNIHRANNEMHSGVWKKRMGFNLSGKKIGIVGFGRIGKAVADLFSAIGAEVAYTDPVVTQAKYPGKSLNDLLEWVDIVSVHCSPPATSQSLIGPHEIGMMREGAWLINCARGGVVAEASLYEAIQSGHLAGAAIDVFEKEPYTGPLAELENVILTPHIGSYARESRIQMEIDAVKNLIEAIAG